MFLILKQYAGLIKIAAYIIVVLLTAHFYADYRVGKLERILLEDNVTILRDGKEITDEVTNATDSELCAVFGGCEGLSDDPNSD